MLEQEVAVDYDNMSSNLTSAISNETSISSNTNINEMDYPQQNLQSSFASPSSAPKRRRNLPGNPDPEAEVVALSPRSLMATNRFVCEICNKGFQRDQNLQLHRRGHNLPWKLKQRCKQEVIKKRVYVCPEASCVHHVPSRALGDLTGIKKHFSRKHGEKKWKCEKCSKRYAVQSDWKAHSKICGTREYRCDCGTLFSRRDSFITHRAFCDALAQESSRSIILTTQQNPLFMSSSQTAPNYNSNYNQQNPNLLINLPPWLSSNYYYQPGAAAGPPQINPLFTSQRVQQSIHDQDHPNPNNKMSISSTTFSSPSSSSSSLMSATALLQKAAQMGVTMSTTNMMMPPYQSSPSDQSQSSSSILSRPHHHHHVGAADFCATTTSSATNIITAGCSVLPSREGEEENNMGTGFVHGLASFANKVNNANVTQGGCMQLHDMNMVMMTSSSLPSTSGAFDGSSSSLAFDGYSFNEMLNPINKRSNFNSFQENAHLMMSLREEGSGGGGGGGVSSAGGGDGLTRDFLGLRAFPDDDHRDFLNMAAGLDQMGYSTSYDHDDHLARNQGPWQSN